MTRAIVAAALGLALLAVWIAWLARRDGPSAVSPEVLNTARASTPADRIEAAVPRAGPDRAATGSMPSVNTTVASVPPTHALDSAEILVRGVVRDEHAQPIPGCALIWFDEHGQRRDVATQAGAYSVPGLHPGAYIVVLWGTDLRREEIDTTLAAEPAVQQRDFVAHAQPDIVVRLKGREAELANAGGAAPSKRLRLDQGLSVRASLREPRAELRSMPNDSVEYSDCGTFFRRTQPSAGAGFPADGIGRLVLNEAPPLFVGLYCGATLLESRRLAELPRELVFDLAPERILAQRAAVRARLVRSDDAAPIPAKMVMLDLLPKNTDAEGRVEYSNLIPGPHSFEILLEDGSTQMQSVVLSPGKLLDLGDVALRPIEMLRVHFEFPTPGRAEVNFTLTKDEPGDPLAALALGTVFQSQPEDPTRIPFPGAGSFVLRVVSISGASGKGLPPLAALPLRLTLRDAPTAPLTVTLLPTTAVCLRPPRDAKRDSRWLIALANGEPFKIVRCRGREPTSVGLPQGSYTIARIDPLTENIGSARSFVVGPDASTVELKP